MGIIGFLWCLQADMRHWSLRDVLIYNDLQAIRIFWQHTGKIVTCMKWSLHIYRYLMFDDKYMDITNVRWHMYVCPMYSLSIIACNRYADQSTVVTKYMLSCSWLGNSIVYRRCIPIYHVQLLVFKLSFYLFWARRGSAMVGTFVLVISPSLVRATLALLASRNETFYLHVISSHASTVGLV